MPRHIAGRHHGRMGTGVGSLIRQMRHLRGWSQSDLARELCKVAEHATVTREEVSRWEREKRIPGPFWTRSLSTVLLVPLEEFDKVKRRDMILLSGVALSGIATGSEVDREPQEIFSSVAAGDEQALTIVQTSHATDLTIASYSAPDKGTILHLTHWLERGRFERPPRERSRHPCQNTELPKSI